MTGSITWNSKKQGVDQADFVCNRHPKFFSGFEIWYKKKTLTLKRQEVKNKWQQQLWKGKIIRIKVDRWRAKSLPVLFMRSNQSMWEKRGKIITGIISQASSIDCWVYVQDGKKRLRDMIIGQCREKWMSWWDSRKPIVVCGEICGWWQAYFLFEVSTLSLMNRVHFFIQLFPWYIQYVNLQFK